MASDSNAIVPIVPFEDISRPDWKPLAELVGSGFNRRANVVVCTHLHQVSQEHMNEELRTVTTTFWPRGVLNINRVIPCSLIGLSVEELLDRSQNTLKPPFEAIWNEQSMSYHVRGPLFSIAYVE